MNPEDCENPIAATLYLAKGSPASKGLLRFALEPALEVHLAARLVGLLLVLKTAWKLHRDRGDVPDSYQGRLSFTRIAAVLGQEQGYRLEEKTIENYIYQIRRAVRKAASRAGIPPPCLLVNCGDRSIRLGCELGVVELDEQIGNQSRDWERDNR